ncbi:MAG: ferritin-like domain-containing protein [Polyangiales bacterium]
MRREIGIEGSGTPLEKEYRAVDEALRRTEALVPEFDAKAYDPRAIERVRAMWLARMAVEHRSTTVFSNLAAQLFEANASLDAKLVMLRMAQDEIRHTETCGNVVRALGGEPRVMVETTVSPLATHAGCTPEERALRNVLYTTCLSEMVAVARLVDEIDETKDPYLRDATRRLLADEVLHGQYGFHYLGAWTPWLDANPEVRGSLERYLVHAFAVLEKALGARSAPMSSSEDERALGLGAIEHGREIFFETITHAILPGLERFGIDASGAWKRRALLEGGTVPLDVA